MTPTARSLQFLRKNGWAATVVEQHLPIPGRSVTRDAWGFADILAYGGNGSRILLVQTTTSANVSARLHKMLDQTIPDPHTGKLILNTVRLDVFGWLDCGGLINIHGWKKDAKTGAWGLRQLRFEPRSGQRLRVTELGNPVMEVTR